MANEKMTKQELIGAIEKMTVLELAELVKALEEKFGVSAAPAAVAVPAAAAAGAGSGSRGGEDRILRVHNRGRR